MRMPKPKKKQKPKPPPTAIAKHPMAPPGMRWIPSLALSPANLLQLQQGAGNQAALELLKRYADPGTGSLAALKTYHAARRDGVEPVPGAEGEALMASQDPRFGDWKFQFVADANGGGTAMYWITLGQYKNRQRHIWIDAVTNEPLEVTGGDLDERDRQRLVDWAALLLAEQLSGAKPAIARPALTAASPPEEEEEDWLGALLADDGGDDGGPGAAIAAAAAARQAAQGNGRAGGRGKGGASPGPGGGSGGSS